MLQHNSNTPVSSLIAGRLRSENIIIESPNTGIYIDYKYYPPSSDTYLSVDNYDLRETELLAPTKSDLSKWLWDNYAIGVELNFEIDEEASDEFVTYIKYVGTINRNYNNGPLYSDSGTVGIDLLDRILDNLLDRALCIALSSRTVSPGDDGVVDLLLECYRTH